eukprot:scaffold68856_cov23-Prasinocladus_malaysianus.AAC.1
MAVGNLTMYFTQLCQAVAVHNSPAVRISSRLLIVRPYWRTGNPQVLRLDMKDYQSILEEGFAGDLNNKVHSPDLFSPLGP